MNIGNLKDDEITFDLVKKDVDYDDFMFLIRHLVHELARYGAEGFMKEYKDFMNDDVPYEQKAFVCGMFKHLGYKGEFDIKPDCIILMWGDWYDFEEGINDKNQLLDLYHNTPEAWRQYGVLYVERDTFADGTEW